MIRVIDIDLSVSYSQLPFRDFDGKLIKIKAMSVLSGVVTVPTANITKVPVVQAWLFKNRNDMTKSFSNSRLGSYLNQTLARQTAIGTSTPYLIGNPQQGSRIVVNDTVSAKTALLDYSSSDVDTGTVGTMRILFDFDLLEGEQIKLAQLES